MSRDLSAFNVSRDSVGSLTMEGVALADIAREFELLRAEAEGTLTVRVTSALPIEPNQQQQLIEKLSKRFARKVSLEIELQPELIGGAIINAGSVVIDGSVRGKLLRMHNEIAA